MAFIFLSSCNLQFFVLKAILGIISTGEGGNDAPQPTPLKHLKFESFHETNLINLQIGNPTFSHSLARCVQGETI